MRDGDGEDKCWQSRGMDQGGELQVAERGGKKLLEDSSGPQELMS